MLKPSAEVSLHSFFETGDVTDISEAEKVVVQAVDAYILSWKSGNAESIRALATRLGVPRTALGRAIRTGNTPEAAMEQSSCRGHKQWLRPKEN